MLTDHCSRGAQLVTKIVGSAKDSFWWAWDVKAAVQDYVREADWSKAKEALKVAIPALKRRWLASRNNYFSSLTHSGEVTVRSLLLLLALVIANVRLGRAAYGACFGSGSSEAVATAGSGQKTNET